MSFKENPPFKNPVGDPRSGMGSLQGSGQPAGFIEQLYISDGTVIIDDNGIQVTGGRISVTNPGGTVIIDGNSDMFRILATGTQSKATNTGDVQVTVNTALPGLGTFTSSPSHLHYIGLSTAASGDHFINYTSLARGWVAGSSGGSPTNPAVTPTIGAEASTYLDGSNNVNIITYVTNANAGAQTASIRYYILMQAAF